MLRPFTCLVFAVTAAAHLSGCASIVSGKNQPISVETRIKAQPVNGARGRTFCAVRVWQLSSAEVRRLVLDGSP